MNILVIGNGFDLAHGLPTSYKDFLEFTDNYMSYAKSINDNLLSELKTLVSNNCWLEYFKRTYIGNGWIDFEKEMSNVIMMIDQKKDKFVRIGEPGFAFVKLSDKERKILMYFDSRSANGIIDNKDFLFMIKERMLNDLNRLISVRIVGETEEQCLELQSLFSKNVELYVKEVQKKYNNHSLEQTLSKAYHTTDGGVSSAKSSYDSQIVALYNEYQTLYNTLDEDQIALYDELVNPEKIGKEKKEEGLSLKYVAIGILFGGFIAVVVIVLLTMSNGKIFVQRQITNRELARVFGTYGRNKNNTARLILGDIGTDKPSQLDIIVAKVSVYCKKKGFTELTIIDDCATDSGKSQMKHVIDSIEKGGIQCNKITLSEGDTKYTELCGKNNILVIEELGKGTLKELEYMFMQLKDLESEVSGIICVQ